MEAILWERADSRTAGTVRCLACRHGCLVPPGGLGFCGVRQNRDGSLYSLVSDGLVSAHADPVEKKPLYHYLPGTRTFSFGTEGCNFRCAFCQNAEISQHPRLSGHIRQQAVTPEALVQATLAQHCASVAFTYTEPTVFIELLCATARNALASGLGTIMVSNGYQSPEALRTLAPLIQAANIDLKSMNPEFYRDRCHAALPPVLDNLRRMLDLGWWLEITTLIIPGLNDSPEELASLAEFIARELGPQVPWHVSAFHPAFAMSRHPATTPECIDLACRIGREAGLHFVYPGNVPPERLSASRSSFCPACGALCVERDRAVPAGFSGVCPSCGTRLPGIWTLPTGGRHG